MLEKNKTYTYEELKQIFDEVKVDVMVNPFGDKQSEAEEQLGGQAMFGAMLTAIPIFHTLERKLFGEEENKNE